MRQSINFYRGAQKAPTVPFGAEWMLLGGLALASSLTLWSVMGGMENRRLQAQLDAATRQSAELGQKLTQTKLEHPDAKPDAALQAEITHLERYIGDWNRLFQSIQGETSTGKLGFAAYFEGLARKVHPDLWLTAIKIGKGGETLNLQGCALDKPSVLSEWLIALNKEPVFNSKSFSLIKIKPKEAKSCPVEFDISTPGQEEEKIERH